MEATDFGAPGCATNWPTRSQAISSLCISAPRRAFDRRRYRCEALIRWNIRIGPGCPSEFIPFASSPGSSRDRRLGFAKACAASLELGALRPDSVVLQPIGRQAGDPKLIRALTDAARAGVALEHLGVEITKATRCATWRRRAAFAARCASSTCGSDRRLRNRLLFLVGAQAVTVDIVKIDRSFISGLLNDPHDETIAETIISISERFGFKSLPKAPT